MRRGLTMFGMCAAVLIAASCARPAAALRTDRPTRIEDLLQIDQAGPPTWSPDGRRIGFQWGLGTERDFWTVDAAAREAASRGHAAVRQVAPLTGRSDAVVSPDWRLMAYVAKKHLWVVPLPGGRPTRLTTEEGKYSEIRWAPDSAHLAFLVERPYQDDVQDDIAVVAATGGKVTMIAATPRDEDSPIWSPASDRLAFIRRFDDWTGYEIWVSGLDGTGQHQVVRETYQKGVEEFRLDGNGHWSPDGKRLVYLSSRTGFNHVWTVAVDGQGAPTELTNGPFVDYDATWSPDGSRILFVSGRGGELEDRYVWTVSTDGRAPVRLSGDGLCARPAWSPDGRRVAYLRSSATQPPEIAVQDARAGAPAVQLTESRPDPAMTADFVEPETLTWASKDGMRIHGVLLRPRGRAVGSRPALMYFHGKGSINLKGWGGLADYAFHQYLVRQGYAVLFVNWRGTHVGYGAAYEQANYRDYGGGELDDVVAGGLALEQNAGADPKRIACWGGSYGGYMTMLAMTKTPQVCSAGISLYGVSDWTTFLRQSKRKLWRMRLVAKLGDPTKDPDLWNQSAAIRYAAQARSPLLILQGLDDDGVMPVQGESLYDSMKQLGKTVDYIAYVGEGHGFRHTGSLRDLYERVDAFLQQFNSNSKAPTPTQ
jgi:dipeptidyl aminopeptidase/acylaminoacyl peptidase